MLIVTMNYNFVQFQDFKVLAVSGLLTHVFVGPFDSNLKIVSIKSETDDLDSSGNFSGQSLDNSEQSLDNTGQFLDNQNDDDTSEIDEQDDEDEEYYINELTPNDSIKSDAGSDDNTISTSPW